MISFASPRVLTLAKTAVAGMALACASAWAYVLPQPVYEHCPQLPAGATVQQLTDLVVAGEAGKLKSSRDCLSGVTAKWSGPLWPALLEMLASGDDVRIGASLKMLSWRTDIASRDADILPVLVTLLADPAMERHRERIKPLIIAFGRRGMVALPLFRAHIGDSQADPRQRAVSSFIELIRHSATPLDDLLALLDSEPASLDARMAAARHLGKSIPASPRAAPSLMRLIEMAQKRPVHGDNVGAVSGLLEAYLAAEDPATAADYLVSLRTRDPEGIIGHALDTLTYPAGFDERLVAMFDQPALSRAAVATLGGNKFFSRRASPAPPSVVVKLVAMLADPATRPTALAYIPVIGGPMPALAVPLFSYYQTLGQQKNAERQRVLRALEASRGLSQDQLLVLVNDMVREGRAGRAAPPDTGVTAIILDILIDPEQLPAQALPSLVEAFRLAGRAGTPFTSEQDRLISRIGKMRSEAGVDALLRMLPAVPRPRPGMSGWYKDAQTVVDALKPAGDLALPALERQLERYSGMRLALAETMLVSIYSPASKALLARHKERVAPGLLATLAAPPSSPVLVGPGVPQLDHFGTLRGIYCNLMAPESELGITLFRIANLELARPPEVIEQLALLLDDDRADVRVCAAAAILTTPSYESRPIVVKVAAMPGRPFARGMIVTIDMEEARAGG